MQGDKEREPVHLENNGKIMKLERLLPGCGQYALVLQQVSDQLSENGRRVSQEHKGLPVIFDAEQEHICHELHFLESIPNFWDGIHRSWCQNIFEEHPLIQRARSFCNAKPEEQQAEIDRLLVIANRPVRLDWILEKGS